MWTIKNGVLHKNGSAVEQMVSSNTSGNFKTTPKIVVMHYTAGSSARSSAEWFRSTKNKNSSAHVVIERDGTIIQCIDFRKVAWHAGRSRWRDIVGLNHHSIGIELANFGWLRPAGGQWVTFTGKAIADPYIARHRNGNPDGSTSPIGWEPFPDEQFEAARGLVAALISAYGISEIVGHDDIAPIRKSDPGPAFDMTKFRTCLLDKRDEDGDNIGVVASANGLNLRTGPGTTHAVIVTLKNATRVQLLEQDGNWLEVTSLDSKDRPDKTGWVHKAYVTLP